MFINLVYDIQVKTEFINWNHSDSAGNGYYSTYVLSQKFVKKFYQVKQHFAENVTK